MNHPRAMDPLPQPLQDRIALVTHATSEHGRVITIALKQAGARVVSPDEKMGTAGASPSEMLERAVAPFGRLDILVNTHIISPGVPAETLPVRQFKQDIETNLGSVFFWCQAVAQQMREQRPGGGCIINISSVGGVVALPGQSAFCAAMAGVNAMTKVLATEWHPYGIRVVTVGAGLSSEAAERQTLPTVLPDGKTAGHRRLPGHTLTSDSELASVVTYLASAAAKHINGTTVYVDGGWLADGYWE